jgi:hypothetical protein
LYVHHIVDTLQFHIYAPVAAVAPHPSSAQLAACAVLTVLICIGKVVEIGWHSFRPAVCHFGRSFRAFKALFCGEPIAVLIQLLNRLLCTAGTELFICK